MKLEPPSFWYQESDRTDKPLKEILSGPLIKLTARLYYLGYKLRCRASSANQYKAPVPVICLGNLVAGGSGKTPAALALMALAEAKALARKPFFLTRGYGGTAREALLVDPSRHDCRTVGDEALLLAAAAPTVVSRDRARGARLAVAQDADLLIMDDGFQNFSLAKDISLVVIDGRTGFGNGLTIPAGPLREPLGEGFGRADAFIILGEDRTGALKLLPPEKPLFRARIQVPATWIPDTKSAYVAFTGIGHPEKFYETLMEKKIRIAARHDFPDHYQYSATDLAMLEDSARRHGARLITTEKDAVRLPQSFLKRTSLDIMPVIVQWEDPDGLLGYLRKKLKAFSR